MDDDDNTPGSRKLEGDCEIKAPTLGQSTPILEGYFSNTDLLYLLLNRKSATSPSTSLTGISAPTAASSSASASTTSMASSSSKVSTLVTATSSARVSIPAMAFSSARTYIPVAGSSSAQASPSTTASSSDRERNYRLIRDVGSEEGDMHPIRVLEALGEDLKGENNLLEYYHFYAWTRYPVNKVVVRRNRRIGGPGNGTLCWSQGGGKESVKIDEEEGKSKKSIIGWKRNFKFAEDSDKRPMAIIKIGSQSYTFKLDELVTVQDEEKEKAAIVEKQTPRSFLCIYRLKPIMKSSASYHPSCGTVIHEPDGKKFPLVLPSSIKPLTVPQDLLNRQESSLHDSRSSNVGARNGSLQSFGSAHPLVLTNSVQPLTGQENIQMTEASSLDKEDLQCPNVDSGVDHLLHFFLEDEISTIGTDDFLDCGSAENDQLFFPSSAQPLIGIQDPQSSHAFSLCDLQWPILDSWMDQFQSCESAHPGLDAQIYQLALESSAEPLAEQQDLQWIFPLALESSAEPLAEQHDLQWPPASSLLDLQLPMGNSRINDLENYGTANPVHDGENSLLVLPASFQRLSEMQDMQWREASLLQDAQFDTLDFRVDDLQSWGSAHPGLDGQISPLVLESSAEPLAEQQGLQWPQTSSLHDLQLPMGNFRINDLENYGTADPEPDGENSLLVLPASFQRLSEMQDMQWPDASQGAQSDTLNFRVDDLQIWGSAHTGLDGQISPLDLESSAEPLAEQQGLQCPQASSLHDLQLPMENFRINDLENYGTADPEPDGENSLLVLPASFQRLSELEDMQWPQASLLQDAQSDTLNFRVDDLQSWGSAHPGLDGQISPLVLESSAEPLAEQHDLQWPQASSLHDLQLPMGNSRINDLENYGTANPEPDGENSLLLLPPSFQSFTELEDLQWPQASPLQDAQSNTLNFRVDDLQSWGSKDPEPSGLDFLLDLPTSRHHGQDFQLPEAPLDTCTSFPPAMQENSEIKKDDEWNSVELTYKPEDMLYNQGWLGSFQK